ncbi:restriction endonuclease subunit S [Solimonas variicoloris]|uniref:restriction endonuclease subunit S n=1 Tax=Solimonas variicoloris TaxID=254408 RepID=UPI00036A9CDE|nr:restriction endonuclease subunit S [Solimonas variicoloris]
MIGDLKPYSDYKDAGLPWLGQVPAHWDLRPAFGAYEPNRELNRGMKEKTVLSLSYGRIIIKPPEKLRGLVPESFETYQIVNPGDLVLRTTDLQNDHTSLRVGIVRDRGIITSAYLALHVKPDVLPEFGFQFLNVWDASKAIYGYGSGLRQNLDFSHFKRMPVAVPPEAEQAAIVRFLDWANGRLDRAIRAKRKVIALLNEQKQAIIHRVVTRGLDPDVPLKPSGIPWLGDIPHHWEVRRAKQLCKAIIDCKNRTPELVDGGDYTVVRTTNIRNGRFNPKGSFPTDRSNYAIWTQRGAPRQGDVFFTREAPVGEACLVPNLGNLCMGQRMMYFRPDTAALNANFLLHSIYGPIVRRYIEIEVNGSTVGHLRLGQVTGLPLLWCPVDEQERIVSFVETESRPIDVTISRLEREIELLREYRTRLVADIVTGKLDVRDAAAQLPAEVAPEAVEDEAEIVDELDAEAEDAAV